jgi:hypothetical protein
MRIINNADRAVQFQVQAPGSITVWSGEVASGATAERQLPDPHVSCSLQFKTDPPQLKGDLKQGVPGSGSVIITSVYCGALTTIA